jgi:hypothetical protein
LAEPALASVAPPFFAFVSLPPGEARLRRRITVCSHASETEEIALLPAKIAAWKGLLNAFASMLAGTASCLLVR